MVWYEGRRGGELAAVCPPPERMRGGRCGTKVEGWGREGGAADGCRLALTESPGGRCLCGTQKGGGAELGLHKRGG